MSEEVEDNAVAAEQPGTRQLIVQATRGIESLDQIRVFLQRIPTMNEDKITTVLTDVDLVSNQTGVSTLTAFQSLIAAEGDIVNSIMELTMPDRQQSNER